MQIISTKSTQLINAGITPLEYALFGALGGSVLGGIYGVHAGVNSLPATEVAHLLLNPLLSINGGLAGIVAGASVGAISLGLISYFLQDTH